MNEFEKSLIDDLAGLIAIPSVTGDREMVHRALDYTLEVAERLGLSVRKAANGEVGLVECGNGNETFAMLVHVDVVPPGDVALWKTNPFELTADNGILAGRGVQDDKGPLLACIYALAAAKNSGVKFHKKAQIIIGTSEELDWNDMEAYVASEPLPDYGFTPDGEFPICNTEKGLAEVHINLPIKKANGGDAAIQILSVRAGEMVNTVPGSATATLRFPGGKTASITADGKSVHTAMPEDGDNAIINLLHMLDSMQISRTGIGAYVRPMLDLFGDMKGSGMGIASATDTYEGEPVGINYVSITMLRTEEDSLGAVLNFRFTCGTDEEEFRRKVYAAAAKLGGEVKMYAPMPAVHISRETPFLKILASAYEDVTGLKNEFAIENGGTYAKAIKNIVSWGPIFPGEEDTTHEENERTPIKNYLLMTKLFTETIIRVLSTADSLGAAA